MAINERRGTLAVDSITPIPNTDRYLLGKNPAWRSFLAGNMMLYSIIQIDDPIKKIQLVETRGHSFIADTPLVLLFLAGMQR